MSLKYDCGSDLSWEIVEQFSKFPKRVITSCPLTSQIYHKISFPTNIELSSQCAFNVFFPP